MANAISTGQITLVDLTDQRASSFYLQADRSKIQTYDVNNKVYTPNYTTDHITITPAFFFGNEDYSNKMQPTSISYSVNDTAAERKDGTDTPSGAFYQRGTNLYIKQNIGVDPFANTNALRIVATIKAGGMLDETTGLTNGSAISATIEFALITSGQDGAAGTGIESVVVYYNSNNSNSTPPSSWETDLSKVAALSPSNRYLWSYQVTTYTNDQTDTTSKMVIGVYVLFNIISRK